MKNELSLAQWKANKIAEVYAFDIYWKANHYENPEDFPAVLPEADWEEQFSFMWRKSNF